MIGDVLRNTWSIFLGLIFLMLGNGLQGTLIGWRATFEGFSAGMTGLIITGYSIGFLAGSVITARLVRGVGHIRVFAALASLASAAILVQVLWINVEVWFLMRVVTGVCFAGAYVIVESWLNARSTDQSRGRVLSIYMIMNAIGMAGGQWLMRVADPADFDLFVVASIMLSLALVPVLISRIRAPEIELHREIGFMALIANSPVGSMTLFVAAMAHTALFGMGAVYAKRAGFSVNDIALFMSGFILLSALLQWPMGWLSDRMDRRIAIAASAAIVVLMSLLLGWVEFSNLAVTGMFAVLGAFSLALYPLAVALTNDRLEPDQMVGAGATIALISGTGAIFGPAGMGYMLEWFGLAGFYLHLGAVHLAILLVALVFIRLQPAVPQAEQSHYPAVPARATPVVMEAIAQEAEGAQLAEGAASETTTA